MQNTNLKTRTTRKQPSAIKTQSLSRKIVADSSWTKWLLAEKANGKKIAQLKRNSLQRNGTKTGGERGEVHHYSQFWSLWSTAITDVLVSDSRAETVIFSTNYTKTRTVPWKKTIISFFHVAKRTFPPQKVASGVAASVQEKCKIEIGTRWLLQRVVS